MSLASISSGSSATSTQVNDVLDDVPKSFLYGMMTPEILSSNANSSYLTTPDLEMDIDPFIGDYLASIFQFRATAGTAYVRIDLTIGSDTVTVVEISTSSTSWRTPTAGDGKEIDLITSLATVGDATGRHGTLKVFQRCNGGGTCHLKNLRFQSGSSSSASDYLD